MCVCVIVGRAVGRWAVKSSRPNVQRSREAEYRATLPPLSGEVPTLLSPDRRPRSATAAAAVAVATLVIGTTVFFSLPIMIPFLCNTDLIPFASFGFPTWHICLLIGRRAMIRCAVVCRSIKSVFFTRPIRHRPDLYLPPVNHSCRSISWKTKFSGVCRLTFR